MLDHASRVSVQWIIQYWPCLIFVQEAWSVHVLLKSENTYICKPIWWSSSAPWQKWSSWFPMRRNRKGWDSSQLKFSQILQQKWGLQRYNLDDSGHATNVVAHPPTRGESPSKSLITSKSANSHPPWAVPRLLSNESNSILQSSSQNQATKTSGKKTLPTQKGETRKHFQDSKNDYLTTNSNIHKSSLVLSTYLARRGTVTPTTTVPLRTSLLKLTQTGWKTHPKWRIGWTWN